MACNGDGVERTEEKGACHGCSNCDPRKSIRTLTKLNLKPKLFRWLWNADPWMTEAEVEQLIVELRGLGLKADPTLLRNRKYDSNMRWMIL